MFGTVKRSVVEWRIENLSHWCPEVHGGCIKSPEGGMELYPKGKSGMDEHLSVCICGVAKTFTGELSFYSSDGSQFCEQGSGAQVQGPAFEYVLSRIRKSEDFITVRRRIDDWRYFEKRMHTIIHVFEVDLEMSPRWIENITSSQPEIVSSIGYVNFEGLYIESYCKKKKLCFSFSPRCNNQNPFAVVMCMSSKRSRDGGVDGCVERKHVFRDKNSWKFAVSLKKEELVWKGISLLLNVKITTSNLIWSNNLNYDRNRVGLLPINTFYTTEDGGPGPDASSKTDSGLSSGIQACVTSDVPDDSVLSREPRCLLYQDLKFSDVELKCDNVSFPVHRNLLCARSPVFKTMLSTEAGQVVIRDLDPSALSLFLTYLYTGTVEDPRSDGALKLYDAADKYQVPFLKKDCADFLSHNVSFSNVCDILSLADKHRDEDLTAVSHDFILYNYNAVLKSEEWNSLKKNEPSLVANTLTQFAAADRVGRK